MAWLLYEGGSITWGEILKIICDAIEFHVPNMLFSQSRTKCITQFHWFLWKHLAFLLGKVKGTPNLDRPVLKSSDVYDYAGDFQADPICVVPMSSPSQILFENRLWWGRTILNPNILGNFVWGVSQEEICSRLRRLELYPYTPVHELSCCGVFGALDSEAQGQDCEAYKFPADEERKQLVWTELQAVLVKGCDVSHHFRKLMQDIEEDSELEGKRDMFYPLPVITAIAAGIKKRDGIKTPYLRLGAKQLEILTFKIIVCCHLRSQDSLFVLRAVQLLCMHRSKRADICVEFLLKNGVNVERAILLANRMYSKGDAIFTLFKG